MKAVLQSEFAYIRTTFAATIISFAVVYIALCFGMKSAAPLSALCAMEPLLFLITFASVDAANGWGRFRAALPVSRRDIIAGRYTMLLLISIATIVACIALGALTNVLAGSVSADFECLPAIEIAGICVTTTAAMLIIVAFVQPFLIKFGNVAGVRYAMIAFFVCAFALIGCINYLAPSDFLATAGQWMDENIGLFVIICAAVALTAYAISGVISLRIYQRKDL